MTRLGVSELTSILDFAEQTLAVTTFGHVPPMLAALAAW